MAVESSSVAIRNTGERMTVTRELSLDETKSVIGEWHDTRCRRQRWINFKCAGSGLVNRPGCGLTFSWVDDDEANFPCRFESRPSVCPRCNGSLIVLGTGIPVVVQTFRAWDTGQDGNPGEASWWERLLAAFGISKASSRRYDGEAK